MERAENCKFMKILLCGYKIFSLYSIPISELSKIYCKCNIK